MIAQKILRSSIGLFLSVGIALVATPVFAAAPAHSSAPAAPAAAPQVDLDAGAAAVAAAGACVESVPDGAEKPILSERFPARGLSGYAATLDVTVFHGKGESVLPNGLAIRSESEAGEALKKAGFVLPNQDGSARAEINDAPPDPSHPNLAVTHLALPLLVLPDEPGRHTLTLPPLPVAVARKNGDLATVCTHSHVITIEDPIANTPDPMPHPNPLPAPQREEWTALETAVKWIAIGIGVGIVMLWLARWWLSRPKPVPPPPPPRPPWEVALERLEAIREENLLAQDKFEEHFDRVSDAVREYLGDRYGFDGLESTTDEILAALKRKSLGSAHADVMTFLMECDLVKFANGKPTTEECEKVLGFGVSIVQKTIPIRHPRPMPSAEALR